MAEKVAKLNIKRENGYLYFLRGTEVEDPDEAGWPGLAGWQG